MKELLYKIIEENGRICGVVITMWTLDRIGNIQRPPAILHSVCVDTFSHAAGVVERQPAEQSAKGIVVAPEHNLFFIFLSHHSRFHRGEI